MASDNQYTQPSQQPHRQLSGQIPKVSYEEGISGSDVRTAHASAQAVEPARTNAHAAEPARTVAHAAEPTQAYAQAEGSARSFDHTKEQAAASSRKNSVDLPDTDALQAELTKARERSTYFRVLRSTLFSLVVVAAAAVIVATLILPIMQISGSSMSDTLQDQDIVVAVRGSDMQTGDVIAFYYNNKILVKRVIAKAGQWVDIDESGNVYVDNVLLDEPYVTEKALGECNIKLPYQVPENRIFVMGDHRSVSVDSRSTTIGCVAEEQIVGRLIFCVWPMERFGIV